MTSSSTWFSVVDGAGARSLEHRRAAVASALRQLADERPLPPADDVDLRCIMERLAILGSDIAVVLARLDALEDAVQSLVRPPDPPT